MRLRLGRPRPRGRRALARLAARWRRRPSALTVVLTTSRAILAFALAAAIRGATTPFRRRFAAALAAALVLAIAALTVVNVTFYPLRPWDARCARGRRCACSRPRPRSRRSSPTPSSAPAPAPRPAAAALLPFDAHLTPLNVAATLGLPALAGLALAVVALWRARSRPTDLATWGMLAGLALDGLGQDVEDFRHVWVALGLADAGREGERKSA